VVEAVLDPAQVAGETELAVGVGAGDELAVRRRVLAVHVEELRGGLEVRTGQTRVGVGAVLLWWPAAVAVGEAVLDPGQVVLHPLGIGGGGVGVVGQDLAGGVDPLGAVGLERGADGAVVDLGVARRHPGARMAEQPLDDVLWDPGVDQPGADGVTELMSVGPHGLASFVVQTDVALPVPQLLGEAAVGVGLGAVSVVEDPGEQPWRPVRPVRADMVLLDVGSFRRPWPRAG
jgi:hypothetical protein